MTWLQQSARDQGHNGDVGQGRRARAGQKDKVQRDMGKRERAGQVEGRDQGTWPASMAGLRLLPASSMMSVRSTRRSPVSMLTSTSLQLAPKAL